MLITIAGVQHDLQEVLAKPSLNDLFYLKVKSRSEEFPEGMSLARLGEYLAKMRSIQTGAQLLDDPEILLALKGVVYLCRRRAGERLTWDDAGDLRLDEITFVIEDSDEIPAEDDAANPQQAPSDSEADDDAPQAGP